MQMGKIAPCNYMEKATNNLMLVRISGGKWVRFKFKSTLIVFWYRIFFFRPKFAETLRSTRTPLQRCATLPQCRQSEPFLLKRCRPDQNPFIYYWQGPETTSLLKHHNHPSKHRDWSQMFEQQCPATDTTMRFKAPMLCKTHFANVF